MALKVLIVDDMRGFLDLETSFLKRTECAVFKAMNGLEALRLAKTERPDVIFLDLEMPVMNGIECCRFIKSDVDLKDIPVVIVTASSKQEECFKAGCNSYVQKPVDEDRFLKEIKKFVSIKERADRRVKVSLAANVIFKGTRSPGSIVNISRSGMLLETKEPFAVGTALAVDFPLPNAKSRVKAKAMIVRTVKDGGSDEKFGLTFLDIDDRSQAAIEDFISAH